MVRLGDKSECLGNFREKGGTQVDKMFKYPIEAGTDKAEGV